MSFSLTERLSFLLLIVFAVALQIQATIPLGDNFTPLRVNLGDFFLFPAGFIILLSLILRRSSYPYWRASRVEFWLAGLLIVMSVALLSGWKTTGVLSSWAFINKYIGLFILIAFFGVGGWIAQNFKDAPSLFIRVFFGFYLGVLICSAVGVVLQKFVSFNLQLPEYSWDGFMANRNAFMLLTIFVMILIEAVRFDKKLALPWWFYACFWSLMPLFALYNASRTGWIVGGAVLLLLFVVRFRTSVQKVLPFLLVGVILTSAMFITVTEGEAKTGKQLHLLVALVAMPVEKEKQEMYSGDQKRLIAVEDGLELYKRSNLLLGGGLGSYKNYQTQKRGEFIDLIDFTPLWLLVETGILGLVAFGGFFCLCLWVCYRDGFRNDQSFFHRGMFFFLLTFIAASFFHELMYTRVLWFAMGIGMAASSSQNTVKSSS